MPAARLIPCTLLLALPACVREQPTQVEDADLGVAITFPGPATRSRRPEETPFGPIEWFDYRFVPGRRMDESFHLEVGNLPAGTRGGNTTPAVLDTFHAWLTFRFGKITRTDLPPDRGPGFRYEARAQDGSTVAGILLVRRARLHHAQATVAQAADPRLTVFLESFRVK